jgi:hypothetical protein
VREKMGKKTRERERKNGCCSCFGEEDERERERGGERKKIYNKKLLTCATVNFQI